MNNKKLNPTRFILMVLCALVCAHLAYYVLTTVLFNNTTGFAGLAYIPVIFGVTIAVLFVALKWLAKLSAKAALLGIVLFLATMFLIENLLHPSLFSGDGSTLATVNLFVPGLMWDNDFEYFKIFPYTYVISLLFNYAVFVLVMLISRKFLNSDKASSNISY